jgi:hypothetical protein
MNYSYRKCKKHIKNDHNDLLNYVKFNLSDFFEKLLRNCNNEKILKTCN